MSMFSSPVFRRFVYLVAILSIIITVILNKTEKQAVLPKLDYSNGLDSLSKDSYLELKLSRLLTVDSEGRKLPLNSLEMFELMDKIKSSKGFSYIKGVIFTVDTNNVSLSMIHSYGELVRLFVSNKIPVVSYIDNGLTQNAYLMATHSPYIVMTNVSQISGFGVSQEVIRTRKLLNSLGIEKNYFKTSPFKGGHDYDDITPEVKNEFIRESQELFMFFKSSLLSNRKINEKDLSEVFSGKSFYSDDAIKFNLIDRLGYYEDALSYLNSQSKLELSASSVVVYKLDQPESYFSLPKVMNKALFGLGSFMANVVYYLA